ncbi:MAG: hypothetical protein ACRYF2_25820, partial [Janthinobacterium lividum]
GMAELLDPPFLNHMHAASGKAHESGSGSIGISRLERQIHASSAPQIACSQKVNLMRCPCGGMGVTRTAMELSYGSTSAFI